MRSGLQGWRARKPTARAEDPVPLEVRVHGVSGTPPTDLLDRALVDQTTGDAIAGFYVPRLAAEARDTGPDSQSNYYPKAPKLSGYSWGGLTSGSPARALWLLLLPLTLVNVAPRARPALQNRKAFRVAVIWYSARVLALTLTGLYVITGIGIGEDLIGWQCSGGRSCSSAKPDRVFHHLSVQHSFSVEHMLLIGASVPIALLLIIWFSSSRTADRYERTAADLNGYRPTLTPEEITEYKDVELPLASALMWHNAVPVRRLRALHMQVGFALVLWSLLAATEPSRNKFYDIEARDLVPLTVFAYALVVLAIPTFSGHGTRAPWNKGWSLASLVVWLVLAAAGIEVICRLAFQSRAVSDDFLHVYSEHQQTPEGTRQLAEYSRSPKGGLPYFSETVTGICFAAVAALVLLMVAVTCAQHGSRTRTAVGDHQRQRPGLFGFATVAFAALGLFLAAALTAGTYTFVAAWLHTGSLKPGFAEVAKITKQSGKGGPFRIPKPIISADTSYSMAVIALAGLLVIAVGVLAFRLVWPFHGRQLVKDYPGFAAALAKKADETEEEKKERKERTKRARSIRTAMLFGRLVDFAPMLIGAMVLTGLGLLGFFTSDLINETYNVANQVNVSTKTGWRSIANLAGMGAYFAVVTIVGLVSLGALAFRVPKTRRIVGILWDVASFWPRACHPLAAPCYAERTVPDLITYVTAAAKEQPDRAIVLAAHSQGTVISAAAIRQLKTFDDRRSPQNETQRITIVPRLGFLSFGCVLRRLYGRYFPAYFGPRELDKLQEILTPHGKELPRWRNLWRYTDYLGGQVTHGPPQVIPRRPARDLDAARRRGVPPVRGPVEWEWHSPDPPYFDRKPGDTTYSRPERHSNFYADESGYFQLAVCELVHQIDSAKPAWSHESSRKVADPDRPRT